ncbi:MAG: cation transporter [Brevundimonas subvibrioides]|uniref:Cation transporter n=1 Tax=Brevundimonas subvibrioides TaxID=74313 RepID=A0A258HNM4_9CAUL|nr:MULTISPECIES: cation transporter [Brevundimonas]MDZ4112944.1 cation transporter [Brevundimonas sp.]OYX58625.1 MAG: cation transporter [Brevundimonas subvibrioides]
MTEPLISDPPAATGCGCGAAVKFDGASPAYRRILLSVIAINAAAFIAVAGGALLQGSAALGANALDFLADSATYAISLWVIGKSVRVRSGVALLKGASLGLLAVFILGFAIWRAVSGVPPEGTVITGLGLFGFFANAVAAFLLVRHREGDANVRSVWLCTRNDLIQSLVVAAAGGLVWLTASRWPDLIAGAVLAVVFLQSAWSIIRQSRRELRDVA